MGWSLCANLLVISGFVLIWLGFKVLDILRQIQNDLRMHHNDSRAFYHKKGY